MLFWTSNDIFSPFFWRDDEDPRLRGIAFNLGRVKSEMQQWNLDKVAFGFGAKKTSMNALYNISYRNDPLRFSFSLLVPLGEANRCVRNILEKVSQEEKRSLGLGRGFNEYSFCSTEHLILPVAIPRTAIFKRLGQFQILTSKAFLQRGRFILLAYQGSF